MPFRSVTWPLITLMLDSCGIFYPNTLNRSTLAKLRFSKEMSFRLFRAMTLSRI